MTGPDDARLKALFATAPVAIEEASFTAALKERVHALRRRRQRGLVALWVVSALLLAVVLAPFAPSGDLFATAGSGLSGLPELATSVLQERAANPPAVTIPAYWYYIIASCLVPLLLAVLLVRLGRRTG